MWGGRNYFSVEYLHTTAVESQEYIKVLSIARNSSNSISKVMVLKKTKHSKLNLKSFSVASVGSTVHQV